MRAPQIGQRETWKGYVIGVGGWLSAEAEPAVGAGGEGSSSAGTFRFLEDFQKIRFGRLRLSPAGFGPPARRAENNSEDSRHQPEDRPDGSIRLVADFDMMPSGGKREPDQVIAHRDFDRYTVDGCAPAGE
jgi:hypothetical protein